MPPAYKILQQDSCFLHPENCFLHQFRVFFLPLGLANPEGEKGDGIN